MTLNKRNFDELEKCLRNASNSLCAALERLAPDTRMIAEDLPIKAEAM